MSRPLRFIVIGAGMSGILAVIRLREAGYDDITVYEKAARAGGTWRENTYPGLACDVPAHLYTYSFEPNPDWRQRFASGADIQRYFEGVAERHRVYDCVHFNEEITQCEFRDHRWHLRTRRGTEDVADVVIAATGVLHHPAYPDIPGLDSFAGASFHTARWDHGVTLAGKRVGLVGTGSTAVQIVSAIVGEVARLELFQRTPQWILPIDNFAYSDDERQAYRRDPGKLRRLRDDLQQSFSRWFTNAVIDADSPQLVEIERLCRENLENNVQDPVLREKLRPNYRAACKRLIMSSDFYAAIQHPHAALVTEGIECIEPRGVRTRDGQLHELDVLVLATGFRADRFMRPAEVIGRGGVRLADVWAQRPSAYLSISIPEFPNLFMLNGPNGPVGNFSLIEIAELQVDYVLQLVALLRDGRAREITPRQDALEAFEEERVAAARRTVWTTGCKSWYLDDRGVPASWPFTIERFKEEMARPRLEAFDLRA
ncbi:MAG: flavin-containing monooxygenase [Gammaproteobacteria bacterium]